MKKTSAHCCEVERTTINEDYVMLCYVYAHWYTKTTRLKLRYSALVRVWTKSGKLCTKVMTGAILRKKIGTFYM